VLRERKGEKSDREKPQKYLNHTDTAVQYHKKPFIFFGRRKSTGVK